MKYSSQEIEYLLNLSSFKEAIQLNSTKKLFIHVQNAYPSHHFHLSG